jgi:hypothetical protein
MNVWSSFHTFQDNMKIHHYCSGLLIGILLLGQGATVTTANTLSPIQQLPKNFISQSQNIFVTDYIFGDGEWAVRVSQNGRDLKYEGKNYRTGNGIRVNRGVIRSQSGTRKIYTWKVDSISYIVIWNPLDPTFARLQVVNAGKLVLNRLLTAQEQW